MDLVEYGWHDLNYDHPKHGQIVELLIWKPAQCLGDSDLGYSQWRTIDELSCVIYWRAADDPEIYRYVIKKLQDNK